ncbi:MAG: 2OG-Fe(II) oxygenase family protein [Kiloniellales bacterium]
MMIVLPMLPLRTQSITNVYVNKLFTDEQCEQIIASARADAWTDGGVGGHGGVGGVSKVASVRSVSEQYLPVQSNGFPINQILFEINRLNSIGWNFDLTGFVSDDMPYLMRYAADRKDHYDWHIDVGYNKNASRKICFSIQLSNPNDYKGGDIEFLKVDLSHVNLRERGMIIAFPAFRAHRVLQVTKGLRYVIVGWVHGPAFK